MRAQRAYKQFKKNVNGTLELFDHNRKQQLVLNITAKTLLIKNLVANTTVTLTSLEIQPSKVKRDLLTQLEATLPARSIAIVNKIPKY